MSIFEIIMLLCFGAAWPFSVYRSYRSRTNAGKSLAFMCVIFLGYVAGPLHKLYYNYDAVIYLYMLNGLIVLMDILLLLPQPENHGRLKHPQALHLLHL